MKTREERAIAYVYRFMNGERIMEDVKLYMYC